MDRGAWRAAVQWVAKNRTRLATEHAHTEETSPTDVGHVGEHVARSEASSDTRLLAARA